MSKSIISPNFLFLRCTTITLITNEKAQRFLSSLFFFFKLTSSSILDERSSSTASVTRSGIRVVRKPARYGRYSRGKAGILWLVSPRHLFHPCGRSQRRAMRRPRFSKHPPPSFSVLTGRGKKKKTRIGEISPSKIKLLFSLAVLFHILTFLQVSKVDRSANGSRERVIYEEYFYYKDTL